MRVIPDSRVIAAIRLKKDDMKMEIYIQVTAKALDKRDRSRLHVWSLNAAFDCLVDIILRNGGADDGMHLRS